MNVENLPTVYLFINIFFIYLFLKTSRKLITDLHNTFYDYHIIFGPTHNFLRPFEIFQIRPYSSTSQEHS